MYEHLQHNAPAGSILADLVMNPVALLLIAAIGLCLWAAFSDLKRFTIPNAASAALVVGGLLWVAASGRPWLDHLIAFAAVFTLGYAVYALRLLGAGDAKLLAALALWFGPLGSVLLLLHTTIIGAVLAVAWVMSGPARQALIGCGLAIDPFPPRRIPYGVAIAAAAIPALLGLWPAASV